MTIWIDAQLPPAIAGWITTHFRVPAVPVRDLGLRNAEDGAIFLAARRDSAIVMTKDSDFLDLQQRLGPPPQVILISCGNTSNARLREILTAALPTALEMFMRARRSLKYGAPDPGNREGLPINYRVFDGRSDATGPMFRTDELD